MIETSTPLPRLIGSGGGAIDASAEAARAVDLLGVKRVLPIHWGTFPALAGRPEALQEQVRGRGVEVHALRPGESL